MTAELARASEERNEDEVTHGLIAGGDGDADAEDGAGGDARDVGNESQIEEEGDKEEGGTGATAVADEVGFGM